VTTICILLFVCGPLIACSHLLARLPVVSHKKKEKGKFAFCSPSLAVMNATLLNPVARKPFQSTILYVLLFDFLCCYWPLFAAHCASPSPPPLAAEAAAAAAAIFCSITAPHHLFLSVFPVLFFFLFLIPHIRIPSPRSRFDYERTVNCSIYKKRRNLCSLKCFLEIIESI